VRFAWLGLELRKIVMQPCYGERWSSSMESEGMVVPLLFSGAELLWRACGAAISRASHWDQACC